MWPDGTQQTLAGKLQAELLPEEEPLNLTKGSGISHQDPNPVTVMRIKNLLGNVSPVRYHPPLPQPAYQSRSPRRGDGKRRDKAKECTQDHRSLRPQG